ncbi:hypothetical protein DFJ63DRAFT_338258 [Scheffersomyces coipomensis]|uniref:uncharacterized protein n=1 Tax=Scheffersomyces coipomensis TaxID=1788519 RepID=UPI00315C9B7A
MSQNTDSDGYESDESLEIYIPITLTNDLDVPDPEQLYTHYFYIYFYRAFDEDSYTFQNLVGKSADKEIEKYPIHNWKHLKFKMQLKELLKKSGVSFDQYRSIKFGHKHDQLYVANHFKTDTPIVIHENDFYDYKSSTLESISKSPLSHTFLDPKHIHYNIESKHVNHFKSFMEKEYLHYLKLLMNLNREIPSGYDDYTTPFNGLLLDGRFSYQQIFENQNL